MRRPWKLTAIFLMLACGNTTTGEQLGNADAAVSDGGGGEGTGGSTGTGGAAGMGATTSTGGVTGSGGSAGSSGSGGSGGTASADASTGGMPCSSADECPPSGSICRFPVCNGTCGYEIVSPGPVSLQMTGDCKRLECGIDGALNNVVDDADADDMNPCTADICSNGFPSHTPLVNSPCNNGAGNCDSAGNCIGCTADSDCGTSTECTTIACVQGTCTIQHQAAGSFCAGFTNQCDGAGNCIDCVNNGGCDECCVCSSENICVPA